MSAVSLTWLDRLVAAVDPQSAVRRVRARQALSFMSTAGNYAGADSTRRATRFWTPRGTSADQATLPQLPELRARSRDLARNNPLACGALNTVTTSVVGTGLSVQPQVLGRRLGLTDAQATKWQVEAKELFELWAEKAEWCDLAARLNFYELQELAFRSALESGDCFALLPMQKHQAADPLATKIQLIEADRVCNPSLKPDDVNGWAAGIRADANGRPIAYAISANHPGGAALAVNTWTEVRAFGALTGRRNVLHLGTVLRPGQRRGAPYLAPIIEPLHQLGIYTHAEITAAVVAGMFTVFVKTETPQDSGALGGAGVNATTGGLGDNEIDLGAGAIVGLAKDEDIVTANPGRPNQAFDPFLQAILRQIGVALELPFEVLIKHYTSSYSAARAALLEAWRFYKKRRQWLAWQFCQPVYEAVIWEAIATNRLRAPGFLRDPLLRAAWCRAVWIGDAPGAIDPFKEAQAAQARVDLGISDKAAETVAYSGRNWEDVVAQRGRERRAEAAAGLVLTSAPGSPRQGAVPQDPAREDQTDEETA